MVDECVICMESRPCNVTLESCGHKFHIRCIGNIHKPECPLCRQRITDKDILRNIRASTIDISTVRFASIRRSSIELPSNSFAASTETQSPPEDTNLIKKSDSPFRTSTYANSLPRTGLFS